jgi:hypothetical protein
MATDGPRVMPGTRCESSSWKVVARDGIEPSTRGFSVARRARFGARKSKKGNEFSTGRPNRPGRPSLCRTPRAGTDRAAAQAQEAQGRRRIATERGPNGAWHFALRPVSRDVPATDALLTVIYGRSKVSVHLLIARSSGECHWHWKSSVPTDLQPSPHLPVCRQQSASPASISSFLNSGWARRPE